MAHHASAKKRIRQTERRTAVNRNRVGAIRTSVKKVELAIASGDQSAAQEALNAAQPVIQGSVNKGVIHRNTAARRISRLSARVKAMQS